MKVSLKMSSANSTCWRRSRLGVMVHPIAEHVKNLGLKNPFYNIKSLEPVYRRCLVQIVLCQHSSAHFVAAGENVTV